MKLLSSSHYMSKAIQYPCTHLNETYSVRTCSTPRLHVINTTRCCLTLSHRQQPVVNIPASLFLKTLQTQNDNFRDKWKEYQGLTDWAGLLDPLDDNLRREILRYGGFVDATYKSFDFDPSSPSYATCKFSKNSLLENSGLTETGYRLTHNLHVTSGISLPKWAPQSMVKSSWIGYVAVCQDSHVINRLGRRDVVIAFRGTATPLEWLENLRATLTNINFDSDPDSDSDSPMVAKGLLSLYTSAGSAGLGPGTTGPSLRESVREAISMLLQRYGDEPLSLTITGHSLGAALATLAAYDIKTNFPRAPLVTVMSFGGPRVGNRSFRSKLEEQGTKVLRIVNADDLITKVPGFIVDQSEGHVAKERSVHVAGLPKWIRRKVEDTPWVYAEVGKELRLSSRDCPDNNLGSFFNVATCHDLKTYLYLVENFVSSTCPLRATARKFLRKTKATTATVS